MIKPTQDFVVLELIQPDTANITSSGIFLPETAKKDQPQVGIVRAVGPGFISSEGIRLPMKVNVGDKVMFTMFAGNLVNVDGTDYLVIREREIYGIFTD